MNIANKSIKDWSNLTQYYKKCGTKKYKNSSHKKHSCCGDIRIDKLSSGYQTLVRQAYFLGSLWGLNRHNFTN